jgi:hypothetical protein
MDIARLLEFQVFEGSSGWTALDELLLLEAIKLYGFGNWR